MSIILLYFILPESQLFMRSLLFALLFTITSVSLIASDIYKTVSELKFRKEANSHSHAYGTLKSGVEVKVIDKSNAEWFKIEHDGKTGFVSSKYLTLVKAEEVKQVVKPTEVKQEEKSSSSTVWLIVIGALILLYIIGKATKKEPEKKKEMDEERKEKIRKSIKITVSTSRDDSVVDVTGKSVNISSHTGFTQEKVPFWKHQYVFAYSEINGATKEQKQFYEHFKQEFIKGKYIDLQGNLNYAFILLFDFLQEYDNHLSLNVLENQINNLGAYYPKTKSYGIDFLVKRMELAGDTAGVNRLGVRQGRNYGDYNDYWKLGNQYKTKLNLSEKEVGLLNSLVDTGNKFNSLEFFATNLIRVFLETVSHVENSLIKEGSTIREQSDAVAVIEIEKHYRFRKGSQNYKSTYAEFINTIYQTIYKICENALREKFNVGRKTELTWYIHSEQGIAEFKNRFEAQIGSILPSLIEKLPTPDPITELKLNEYNKTRWKLKIEELESSFDTSKPDDYVRGIYELGKANERNPSVENIYYQASKFIAKHDKKAALKFYVEYLYCDLVSVKFDNKQLTKTIQKSLFKTNEQLHDFEVIIGDLIKSRNKKKALEAVDALYTPKRKKIKLDTAVIKEVHEKHSDTVELLNEYLQDEFEDEQSSIKTKEINTEEVKIEITRKADIGTTPQLSDNIGLNDHQMELLELLSKNSFSITQQQLTAFAKSKGVLKNQLVESINEACFEKLDDILIEEDGDNYIINENYYQQIFVQ